MNKDLKYSKLLYVTFMVIASLVIWVGFFRNVEKEKKAIIEYARIEAEASYNKDVLYRLWAANHQGVYVPISGKTQPNPALSGITERDIETPSGKKLTLVNPAYMTRQVFELADSLNAFKGNIVSLTPLGKNNYPDSWEAAALQMLKGGSPNYYSVEKIDSQDYLQYMSPLIMEKACLNCHFSQGYKAGDLHGGISISVPLGSYQEISKAHINSLFVSSLIMYIIALLILNLAFRFLFKEIKNRILTQAVIESSEAELKIQNKEYFILNEKYKAQYAELLIAKDRAEESDQLKAAFLQNLSHEIRTPLNAVCGFSELLIKEGQNKDRREEYAEFIQSSSKQLLSIVNDVLTISALETRQEKLNLGSVCINHLLMSLHNKFNETATTNAISLKVHLNLENDASVVLSDYNKLSQILSEFISNALKFTLKGSIEFGYKLENKILHFFVKDTGKGIAEEQLHKIFDIFKKGGSEANYSNSGVGIGLSICKGYAHLMNGSVDVQTEYGKGSTFYLSLPYIQTEDKCTCESTGVKSSKSKKSDIIS